MSFHYSANASKLLLRQLVEQQLDADYAFGNRKRRTIPDSKLPVIAELLGELHHARGPIDITYAEYALANGLNSSDRFGQVVQLAVELGLLCPPVPKKISTAGQWATTGMTLQLTEQGRAFTALAASDKGRQQAWEYLAANRHRMNRKSRSRLDRSSDGHDLHPGCTQNAPKTHPDSKRLPPPRTNDSHPLGETTPTPEAAKNDLEGGSHREKEISKRFQGDKELSRTAVAVAAPIDRSESSKAIKAAVRLFDTVQRYLGGPVSDDQTAAVLQQAATAYSDDETISRVAVGLQVAHGWAWVKGNASPFDAGQCLHAAMQDKIWELVPQENCDLMTDLPPIWNGSAWIENISRDDFYGLVRENVIDATRAPAALNKEIHQESAQDASEAIAEASDAGSFVNSFAAPPSEHQEKMSQEDLRRQALVNFKPTIVATENVPSADAWAAVPDVSEDYFASARYGRGA